MAVKKEVRKQRFYYEHCSLFDWLTMICCKRKILLDDWDRWLVLIWCKRKVLLAGD
jgi:hypothetical protein